MSRRPTTCRRIAGDEPLAYRFEISMNLDASIAQMSSSQTGSHRLRYALDSQWKPMRSQRQRTKGIHFSFERQTPS